jgi:hypothetical protein
MERVESAVVQVQVEAVAREVLQVQVALPVQNRCLNHGLCQISQEDKPKELLVPQERVGQVEYR